MVQGTGSQGEALSSSSCCSTWDPVRNADSQAAPDLLGVGPLTSVLTRPSGETESLGPMEFFFLSAATCILSSRLA